jgi:hypothetical protein
MNGVEVSDGILGLDPKFGETMFGYGFPGQTTGDLFPREVTHSIAQSLAPPMSFSNQSFVILQHSVGTVVAPGPNNGGSNDEPTYRRKSASFAG